jgi:transketolase
MHKPQRLVYGEELVELGMVNDRIVVLDVDCSSSTQSRHFGQAFPERFFNLGIAEANMASVAAGFASCGYIPFMNAFALFCALRCGDQVRAQIAYTYLPVKIIGGYAGLSDFADGASHQSVEDIAVMRAIPGIAVVAPSDITETKMAVRAIAEHEGPVFLRLSREAVSDDYDQTHPFEIGKAVTLREGSDVCIIATGTMVHRTVEAAALLEKEGIQARVIDMHTIKPLDRDAVVAAARECGAILTVEEHSIHGGLGGAVAECVCETVPVPVVRCGIPDRFGESGSYEEILARAGLGIESIAAQARTAVDLRRATSRV